MSLPPVIAAKLALDVTKSLLDYAKCREQEKTKRIDIAAKLEVQIKTIQSQEKIFSKYLDQAFSEREALYKSVEKAIEAAVQRQDHAMLKMCLEFKLGVYKKDPLENASSIGGINANNSLEQLG